MRKLTVKSDTKLFDELTIIIGKFRVKAKDLNSIIQNDMEIDDQALIDWNERCKVVRESLFREFDGWREQVIVHIKKCSK
jgi:hypothetical protein